MKKTKEEYTKLLDRLKRILTKLYAGEILNVKDLAYELNTSERTIRRDLNERLLEFPIIKEGGKYFIKEDLIVNKKLNIDEKLILKVLNEFSNGFGVDFAIKSHNLLARLEANEFNPFYSKLWLENLEDKLTEITILESAIKNQNKVDFIYHKESGDKNAIVNPLKIASYDGLWYLIAIDREILKSYYLKDISNIKILKDKFEITPKIDKLLQNSVNIWFGDYEPFEVILYIKPQFVKHFMRKKINPTQRTIRKYEDGSIEIAFDVTSKMEVLPLIKSWIPYIRVVEPKSIVDEIEKDLRSYLNG